MVKKKPSFLTDPNFDFSDMYVDDSNTVTKDSPKKNSRKDATKSTKSVEPDLATVENRETEQQLQDRVKDLEQELIKYQLENCDLAAFKRGTSCFLKIFLRLVCLLSLSEQIALQARPVLSVIPPDVPQVSVQELPFGLRQSLISRTKTKASKHQQSKEKSKEFVPSTAPAEGNDENPVALKVLQFWFSLCLHVLINRRILSNICQLMKMRTYLSPTTTCLP